MGIPLRGRVIFPDGTPAVAATVVATTICETAGVHFVTDTQTSDDGSYVIPSFDSSCGHVRFTAEKREDFWLKTGKYVFYPRSNGTTPEVSLLGTVPPDPVTIQLDLRGGELEFRVWDAATNRHIHAGLMIECPGEWCGAMSTATGKDGTAHTVFVPARRYRLSLNRYMCGSKTYFPDGGPSMIIDVHEGERQSALVEVDVTAIPDDNPKGELCRP
jgi:hypothetical protein